MLEELIDDPMLVYQNLVKENENLKRELDKKKKIILSLREQIQEANGLISSLKSIKTIF